jgi:hypothetical protein
MNQERMALLALLKAHYIQRACSPGSTRLASLTAAAIAGTLRAVQPAALARTTDARATAVAGCATGAAVEEHLQALQGKVHRHFQTHLATPGAGLAIATVQPVMAATGLAPGAATRFAIRTIQAGITWRAHATPGIDQ